MKNIKKEDKEPHFVTTTNPEKEPWLTNFYFGQRDGSGSHGHGVISGGDLIYLRDMNGLEIIN